jgi:hypothetical protein
MQTTAATVNDWGQAFLVSATAALAMFLGAIPKVLGFLVILIIGWFIASALAGIVANLLRAVKFNDLAQRSGFAGFVQNMGMKTDSAGLVATAAKWFVRLIVLTVAFDALGLPAVSQVLQQVLLFIPNVIVALMVLVIGGLLAGALAGVVRGAASSAGLGNPELLSTIARIMVWSFAIVVAVNQIGIATTLINTLFMGFIGALALATGLAFGLGGRDTAAEIVQGWYQSGKQATPQLAQAANAAQRQIEPPETRQARPRAV